VVDKAQIELVQQRVKARLDLRDYIPYMRTAQLPDFHYEPAAHHKIFAHKLKTLTIALRDRTEEGDRQAISVPPGAAKSFYGTIAWPTQLLALNPSWKILCINASERLAEDFAHRRRQILLTPEWEALSGTKLLADRKSLNFMGTPEGGGIYAYGGGATIQGIRADALIGDDLITGHEEASNLSQLDKKWNWYMAEARARVRPGGIELLIATRWALLDPIGRVLRLTEQGHENWDYCRIPMICDSDDDPVGRKIGERLWTEWFTKRMVSDAQRNPLIFQTLYQQNPAVSEHTWVPLQNIHLRKRSTFPEQLTYYIGVDVAHKLGEGDYTVFAVIGLDREKRVYLVDLYRKQCDSNEGIRAYLALQAQYKPRYAFIDNDNASVVWGRMQEEIARQQGMPSILKMSPMKNRDKEVRAANIRALFLQNRVIICDTDWSQPVVREVAEFPGGRNDDIIDAMAVVASEVKVLSGPSIDLKPQPKPIVGAFQELDGLITTTQTLDEIGEKLNAGRIRGRI
jgi:predicted phage terminase large subunit-like protein